MPNQNFSFDDFNQESTFSPSENINIRTMQSDLEKIKSEGGDIPTNNISFSQPQGSVFQKPPSSISEIPSQGGFNQIPQSPTGSSLSSSFHKESETYFETPPISPTEVPFLQETPSPENLSFSPYQTPPTPPTASAGQEFVSPEFNPQSPKKSKLLLPLLLAGVLVAVGVMGYFVIWPKLFKKPTLVTTTTTTLLVTETVITTTTTTTLPPSPFIGISTPYEKAIVEIKVIGEIIASNIRKEATTNLSPVNTFKVIIPSVKGSLTTEEVVLSLIPNLPERLKSVLLKGKYLVYAYYGEVNPSLGLILEVNKEEREEAEAAFLSWEKGKIIGDLSKFVLVDMPKKITVTTCKFKETEFLGAKIRFCDFGSKEKGIGYAFFDTYLIISSSKESLQSAINHLQGPREEIYPFFK